MKKFLVLVLLVAVFISNFGAAGVQAKDERLLPAVITMSEGEKWGYINEKGTFIIKPQYDFVGDFNQKGIAIVANGKWQYDMCTVYFINNLGKVVSGPFKSYIPEFKNGIAVLKLEGQVCKVVDSTGKVILESKNTLYSYSEGLLRFSQKVSGKELYGYMDLTGKAVIAAKYRYAEDFSGGRAMVSDSENNYFAVDKTGKVIEAFESYNTYLSSEGFTPYWDEDYFRYGYMWYDGSIAIEPIFADAGSFRDGYAVVRVNTGEYDTNVGLIDKFGDYVLEPEYSGIQYLGQNLFSVSQNFFNTYNDYGAKKALFNSEGEKLTEYEFYNIGEFNGEYAVASDDTTTFFIDRNGKKISQLPRLKGIGQLSFVGDLIKAELDGGLMYLKRNGEVVWKKDETILLDNNIKLKKVKYRRDFLTFIQYPEIEGLQNKNVQQTINGRLKKLFLADYETAKSDEEYPEEINIDFSVNKNKDLLIVENHGYYYPIGAAHGQPSREYYHIDLKTGTFYALKDLFNGQSKYLDKLKNIVTKQLQLNSRIDHITQGVGYLNEKPEVTQDQGFIIGPDSLTIYYYPYEIAAYAAGFPEFEIPYGQITDIINSKSAFWNAFDKKIITQKVKVLSDIPKNVVDSISSLMNAYETRMIEAINSNSFSKVEGCLLNGSSLYNSQKKLVQSLYAQKIKEKLTKYEIYAVYYDYNSQEYKVFVQEEVAIQYPGKSFVNKPFEWCYTVKYDSKTSSYRLSNIQKW